MRHVSSLHPFNHLFLSHHYITAMPPALGEHGRCSASPRAARLSRLAAPTPNFRRPAETPFGKIRPDFDGFSLAEMSDWLDPQTPAATAGPSTSRTAPLHNYEGTPMNSAVLPSRTPAPSHITPEGKRRRRSLVDPPHHADDLFSRRLADSTRRTPLVPLPTQLNEPAVLHESASAQSRRTSSSASSTGTTMVSALSDRGSPKPFDNGMPFAQALTL